MIIFALKSSLETFPSLIAKNFYFIFILYFFIIFFLFFVFSLFFFNFYFFYQSPYGVLEAHETGIVYRPVRDYGEQVVQQGPYQS